MKRRILALLLTLTMLFSLFPAMAVTASAETAWASSGSGTEADPYIISTYDGLNAFAEAVNSVTGYYGEGKFYKLSDDFGKGSGTAEALTTPICTKGFFNGTFDGNGKTVTLSFGSGTAPGMFVSLAEGTVKNVTTDGTVDGGVANNTVGGVVGYNSAGTVSNCSSSCTVYGCNESNVGGVVGFNSGCVTDCYSSGNVIGNIKSDVGGVVGCSSGNVVNCYSTAVVTGELGSIAGGVVGLNTGCVTDCYSSGNVTVPTSSSAGGVVGKNSLTVTNCYSRAVVTANGSSTAGGVVGDNTGTVKYCYSTMDTLVGKGNSTNCSKITADMKVNGPPLVDALNAYVTENPNCNSIPLKQWQVKTGENNGYPIFVTESAEPDYLTFTSDSAFKVGMKQNGKAPGVYLQYSTDKTEWADYTVGEEAVPAAEISENKYVIYFRNGAAGGEYKTNTRFASNMSVYNYFTFSPDGGQTTPPIAASGNIMTILDYKNPDAALTATYTFANLFCNCKSLTKAPELPATTLTDSCYYKMFYNCISITSAPELPATAMKTKCYAYMFNYCSSLTEAPKLSATSLASQCYAHMFDGCTSLTAAPELPATTLAINCYSNMFDGCKSLTSAPELSATTLADYCYSYMFQYCTSLYVKEGSESDYTWRIPASGVSSPVLEMDNNVDGVTVKVPNSGFNYYKIMPAYKLTGAAAGLPQGTTGGVSFTAGGNSATTAAEGVTVTAAATEVDGYKATISAKDADGQTVNIGTDGTFTMPAKGVTVTATYTVYTPDYLTFTSSSAFKVEMTKIDNENTKTTPPDVKVQYSTDKTTWKDWNLSAVTAEKNSDNKYVIYFRNGKTEGEYTTNTAFASYLDDYNKFAFSAVNSGDEIPPIAASGNIMTILDYKNPNAALTARYTFTNLFCNCSSLTAAPELPATTLTESCYYKMFIECTSLTAAPELPATALAFGCYQNMFYGCSSLTAAPELHATMLAMTCYAYMFQSCNSLYVKQGSETDYTWKIPVGEPHEMAVGYMVKDTAAGSVEVKLPESGFNYYKVVGVYPLTGAAEGLPQGTSGGVTFKVNSANAVKAATGTIVTAAATEVEGYSVTLSAVDADGNEVSIANDGTFTMPAKGVTVTASYESLHTHSFTYTSDGATITATCSAENCPLTDSKLSITLSAPDALKTTEAYSAASIEGLDAWEKEVGETQIEYYRGETTLEGAPTNAGYYKAKITAGDKTVSVDFTIGTISAGDKFYNDLQAAVNAAQNGGTVKLYEDITLKYHVSVNNLSQTENLIIDLNGKTVTPTETCYNCAAFDITGVNVTIKNGKIDGSAITQMECYPVIVRNGNVTLSGLDVVIDNQEGCCVYAFAAGRATIESGTYTNKTTTPCEGSTITGMILNQSNTITDQLIFVKGGTFIGYSPANGDDSGLVTSFLETDYFAYPEANVTNKIEVRQHHYVYTASGAVITYACECATCEGTKYTLTLTAPTATGSVQYTAQPVPCTKVGDAWAAAELPDPTIMYEGTGTTSYTLSSTAPTNVGDYKASITVDGKTATVSFSITKVQVDVPAAASDLVYDGNQKTGVADPDANAKYTVSDNKQTNAGSYTAKAVLKDKTNYEWKLQTPTSEDQNISWSIAKAAPTILTAPAANTLTYSASEQKLVSSGKSSTCLIVYALGTDSTTAPTNNWSMLVPKKTDAGTYYVWYKCVGDVNYSDSTPQCVTVSIAAKSIEGAVVTLGGNALYADGTDRTQEVKSVALNGWTDAITYTVSNNTASEAGTHTLTVEGTGNYTGSVNKDFAILAMPINNDTPVTEKTEVKYSDDPNSGKFTLEANVIGDALETQIETPQADIINAIATAEDLLKVKQGATLNIWMDIKAVDQTQEDETVIEDIKAAASGEGFDLDAAEAVYLDISLFKQFDGKTEESVPTPASALAITITVPEGLRDANTTYAVVRYHEGTVTVLDCYYNSENYTVTFESDQFSLFTLFAEKNTGASVGVSIEGDTTARHTDVKTYKAHFDGDIPEGCYILWKIRGEAKLVGGSLTSDTITVVFNGEESARLTVMLMDPDGSVHINSDGTRAQDSVEVSIEKETGHFINTLIDIIMRIINKFFGWIKVW